MAARPRPSTEEPAGAAEPVKGVEGARGKDTSTQKTDDLMEIVKKLQKAGSLEPRIEFLINRINEVQQAKKKAIEELGEAENVWDALKKELDSLVRRIPNGTKVESSMNVFGTITDTGETVGNMQPVFVFRRFQTLEKETKMKIRKEGRPEQLAREICALDSNKEQLLREEKLVEVRLEDVKRQLCSLCGPEGPSDLTEGLFLRSQEAAAAVQLFREENRKAEELLEAAAQHHQQLKQRCQQLQEKRQRLKEELEKYRVQAQSVQEEGAGPQGVRPEQLAREICALDSNKEQLLREGEVRGGGNLDLPLSVLLISALPATEKLVEVRLEDVKRQLCSLCGPEGPSDLTEGLFLRSQEAAAAVQLFREENRKAEELLEAAAQHHQQLKQRCQQLQEKRQRWTYGSCPHFSGRLKEELEKYRVQAQSVQEEGAGPQGVGSPKVLAVFEEKDPELPTKEGLIPS
ncbi:Synaptonemal complex central element protein 1 [Heterocephalus glaber]|uniref:Synaptonemal complex central element protein 1 n=1 Tax=Heterocephalus glaber TaxID=10181 RepID=G5B0T3_HETGA|nr:Synaptonemal complex central element protein 1 [Heterocephalus glaber]